MQSNSTPPPRKRNVYSYTNEYLASLIGTPVGTGTIVAVLPLLGGKKRLMIRCACGTEFATYVHLVVRGRHLCMRCTRKRSYVGAGGRQRMAHLPGYRAWKSILSRCRCKTNSGFAAYGAKGITVCDDWQGPQGFQNFIADVGSQPSPAHEIDRIDNDKGYEPGNCRWATRSQQQRNKRNNHLITFNGKTQTIADWAEQLGVRWHTIYSRIHHGWSLEDALTLKADPGKRARRRRH